MQNFKELKNLIVRQKLDWSNYEKLNNIKLARNQSAIEHYLENWEQSQCIFEEYFDSEYYLLSNIDVKSKNVNPLVHYIAFGRLEGRLGYLEQSKKTVVHLSLNKKNKPGLINIKTKNKLNQGKLKKDLIHEVELTPQELYEIEKLKTKSLDLTGYIAKEKLSNDIDALQYYYLKNKKSQSHRLIIDEYFDSDFYYSSYPDIKAADLNPLYHFVMFGEKEGRTGIFNIDKLSSGGTPFYNDKKTIIIANHESSATGAPLLGYNLSLALSKEYNVIQICLKKKALHEAFRLASTHIASDEVQLSAGEVFNLLQYLKKTFKPEWIICNSVETQAVIKAANILNIPVTFLLHEFAEYTRPLGKISLALEHADKVVVPAQLLKESSVAELFIRDIARTQPNHIEIYPQGKLPIIPDGHGINLSKDQIYQLIGCPEANCKVVLGAGTVQPRKGVDLFIEIASLIKDKYPHPIKFIWVGDGYKPDSDMNYSVWIKSQLDLLGLHDVFYFIDHQKNLDVLLEISDVFLLSSRLDPFPNVVIDALVADVHVACFDKTTGVAEFLQHHNANATVLPFGKYQEMATSLAHYLSKINKTSTGVNQAIAEKHLNFDNYVEFIKQCCEEAKQLVVQKNTIESFIAEKQAFNGYYFDGGVDEPQSLHRYVNAAIKGMHYANPKPGFSELEWISRFGNENHYQVPLYEALKLDKINTHQVVNLKKETINGSLFVAIHLHLYYQDLATEFSKSFSNLPAGFDLYLTICHEAEPTLLDTFRGCGASNIFIIKVKNRGRDIAPLFIDLAHEILPKRYNVIGHFHSKKSLSTDSNLGDNWRKYLVNNLIGSQEHAAQLLAEFYDTSVGLVFADDRHCVDYGINEVFGTELCQAMNMPPLEHPHIFPLGTMFWARMDAIKSLFQVNLNRFIVDEPLPYDGSSMHAIERLIPHIVTHQGYKFKTTYLEGTYW